MREPLPFNTLEWFDDRASRLKEGTKDLPALIRIPLLLVIFFGFPFIMFGFIVVGIPLLIVYLIFSAIGRAINGQGGKGPSI